VTVRGDVSVECNLGKLQGFFFLQLAVHEIATCQNFY